MLTQKKISVISVCYNDAGSVREMYRRVTEVMKTVSPNYEIIYVDDKSPDNALEILRELAAGDKRLKVIVHSRNFGANGSISQIAYTTGMRYCTGDVAILIDGDLQDPPEMFPEFIKKWLDGYNIVYGIGKRRGGGIIMNFFRLCFYSLFAKLSYLNIPIFASDFCLLDRKALNAINSFREVDRYIRGMRPYVGFKSIGVPYERSERYSGVGFSTRHFLRFVKFAKKLIFSFSYKPIEGISYMGLIFVLIGVIRFSSLFFVGGVILLALSIIGEYIARIFDEVKGRPIGIIEEIINDDK